MALEPFTGTLDPAPASTTLTPFNGKLDGQQPKRSALGEIGNQLYAGTVVELPSMVGKAAQYLSEPGKNLYDWGKGVATAAEERGKRPDLQPTPDEHNGLTNMLAAGARMIPQSVAPAAVVGGAIAAAPFEVPLGIATGAASVLGALPAGLSQAQTTLDKAQAAGVNREQAIDAARKTGAIEWGGEALGNYAGAKLMALGGKALSSTLASTGKTAAAEALEGATSKAVLKPFLRQFPESLATEVGTEMGQNAGEAWVEKQAGIDKQDPWEAAKEAVGPTVGMTLLLAPFGLAGHGLQARANAKRAESLSAADANPEARARAAAEIQSKLEDVDKDAAQNFGLHAAQAISNGAPLQIGEHLFAPPTEGQYARPAEDQTPEAQRLGFDSLAGTYNVFPDGSVATTREAEALHRYAEQPGTPPTDPIEAAGQQWQGLGIAPTTGSLDQQRGQELSSLLAADEAGNRWQQMLRRRQMEADAAGAAAGRATDQRIADVGQQWQSLGISDPTDDLARQRAGFAPNPAPTLPSAAMGLNPKSGPLSRAAAAAVDGTSLEPQPQGQNRVSQTSEAQQTTSQGQALSQPAAGPVSAAVPGQATPQTATTPVEPAAVHTPQTQAVAQQAAAQASPSDDLVKIFKGLDGRSERTRVTAESAMTSHPQARQMRFVQNQIYDILGDLQDSGLLKINC